MSYSLGFGAPAVACPAGQRISYCGPCIPVGQKDDPTCGNAGPSGQTSRYDDGSSDPTDTSSSDESTDVSSGGGGGGNAGGGQPYYDSGSGDGDGGASLATLALGVGTVGLIGLWFYMRVS